MLVFLFLINFVVYEAALLALNISGFSLWVSGILGIFGMGFVLSMIFGTRFYNTFTRVFSFIFMTWLGFFGYLFLVSVLYILVFIFSGIHSIFFASILFIVATITGIYGIFHVNKIIIKEVSVFLSKLPEIWRDKKVVWISDLHIGQINGKKYMDGVIEQLKKISPDILFIGGDLFDGIAVEGVLKCIEPLRNLVVPLGIYFITGNHEEYGDSGAMFKKINELGIKILRDEKIIIDGLQIIGVDFTSTAKKDDFKNVLVGLAIDKNTPSILLKHEPRYIEVAEEAGISLQISGHTHKAQQWPFEYLARLMYGRFAYGFQKMGNTQVYTSSGVGTWGPPLRVGTDSEIVFFKFK